MNADSSGAETSRSALPTPGRTCACQSCQFPQFPEVVPFFRLRLVCRDGELDPVFEDGNAPVTLAEYGVVIEGVLVDCPVLPGSLACVVLDTPRSVEAFVSPTLDNFVVENAPCHLEFLAVEVCKPCGCRRWDWMVHEISPSGCRIPVSDPRREQ